MAIETLHDQASRIASILPRLLRQLSVLQADDPAMELPIAQMRVCSLLYDGPHTMSALSRELGISLSAMTQIADRLERGQMVERVLEPEDRRVKTVRLTDHGQTVMRLRRKKRIDRISEVMEHLDPESRAAVLNALQTLLDACRKTARLADESAVADALIS